MADVLVPIHNDIILKYVDQLDGTHALKVAGGGSGGSTTVNGLSDTLLRDDSGTLFLARDNGTAITYVNVSGAAYVPTSGVRAADHAVPGYAITQYVINVTATSQIVVSANTSRRYLAWMVVGTEDVTVSAGLATAVHGVGLIYQASGLLKQGSSQEFPNGGVFGAFKCVAAATGSKLIVWEGL